MKINHKMDASWQAGFKSKWRKAVLYDNTLKTTTKLVAVATLEDYNRTDPKQVGTTFNSAEGLGEKIGVNEKTVRNAWNELRKAGYLHSLGRSSGGRGVYIHRFDMPDEVENIDTPDVPTENSPVNGSGQTGKIVRSDRADCPMEQGELNKRNYQVEPPLGGHSQANEPMDITYFIEVEEKQRRDEFINYWSTVAMKYDNHHDYLTVLAIFSSNEDMADERRTDWGATFMHFMANMAGATPTEGSDMKVENAVTDLDSTDEPTTGHENLMKVWQGRADDEGAFRKAWEHLIAGGHEPIHVLAVGASEHVGNKYPRELGDVLTTLPKYKRSKAVAAYKRATLT